MARGKQQIRKTAPLLQLWRLQRADMKKIRAREVYSRFRDR